MKTRAGSPGPGPRAAPSAPGAFTLIEVVLALTIATGLLVTALLFYRQATELRAQILRESEVNTATRLVLEKLAADLREATATPGDDPGFVGGPDSLALVRGLPADPSSTNLGLVRVTFSTVKSTEGTNSSVVGIDRREQPWRARAPRPRTNDVADEFAANNPAAETNAVPAPKPRPQPILTEDIHHLRFRYWTGASWTSWWTNQSPPTGVEIVLGPDALDDAGPPPPDVPAAESIADPGTSGTGGDLAGIVLFRRVVFLPAGIALQRASDESFGEPASP